MKLILIRSGEISLERVVEGDNLPPFFRIVSSDNGIYAETQVAPRYNGEYYALWGKMTEDTAVYVYIEPERVYATEWCIDGVLHCLWVDAGHPPSFLSVFPGGVCVPMSTPGAEHADAKLYVLRDIERISTWQRKAIYKRADIVYYPDPPARLLKRLLDV